MRISSLVEKTQTETTASMRQRAQLVGKWKTTLEVAIKAMADEISTLEEERVRLKKSLVILGVPESIGALFYDNPRNSLIISDFTDCKQPKNVLTNVLDVRTPNWCAMFPKRNW